MDIYFTVLLSFSSDVPFKYWIELFAMYNVYISKWDNLQDCFKHWDSLFLRFLCFGLATCPLYVGPLLNKSILGANWNSSFMW